MSILRFYIIFHFDTFCIYKCNYNCLQCPVCKSVRICVYLSIPCKNDNLIVQIHGKVYMYIFLFLSIKCVICTFHKMLKFF